MVDPIGWRPRASGNARLLRLGLLPLDGCRPPKSHDEVWRGKLYPTGTREVPYMLFLMFGCPFMLAVSWVLALCLAPACAVNFGLSGYRQWVARLSKPPPISAPGMPPLNGSEPFSAKAWSKTDNGGPKAPSVAEARMCPPDYKNSSGGHRISTASVRRWPRDFHVHMLELSSFSKGAEDVRAKDAPGEAGPGKAVNVLETRLASLKRTSQSGISGFRGLSHASFGPSNSMGLGWEASVDTDKDVNLQDIEDLLKTPSKGLLHFFVKIPLTTLVGAVMYLFGLLCCVAVLWLGLYQWGYRLLVHGYYIIYGWKTGWAAILRSGVFTISSVVQHRSRRQPSSRGGQDRRQRHQKWPGLAAKYQLQGNLGADGPGAATAASGASAPFAGWVRARQAKLRDGGQVIPSSAVQECMLSAGFGKTYVKAAVHGAWSPMNPVEDDDTDSSTISAEEHAEEHVGEHWRCTPLWLRMNRAFGRKSGSQKSKAGQAFGALRFSGRTGQSIASSGISPGGNCPGGDSGAGNGPLAAMGGMVHQIAEHIMDRQQKSRGNSNAGTHAQGVLGLDAAGKSAAQPPVQLCVAGRKRSVSGSSSVVSKKTSNGDGAMRLKDLSHRVGGREGALGQRTRTHTSGSSGAMDLTGNAAGVDPKDLKELLAALKTLTSHLGGQSSLKGEDGFGKTATGAEASRTSPLHAAADAAGVVATSESPSVLQPRWGTIGSLGDTIAEVSASAINADGQNSPCPGDKEARSARKTLAATFQPTALAPPAGGFAARCGAVGSGGASDGCGGEGGDGGEAAAVHARVPHGLFGGGIHAQEQPPHAVVLHALLGRLQRMEAEIQEVVAVMRLALQEINAPE